MNPKLSRPKQALKENERRALARWCARRRKGEILAELATTDTTLDKLLGGLVCAPQTLDRARAVIASEPA